MKPGSLDSLACGSGHARDVGPGQLNLEVEEVEFVRHKMRAWKETLHTPVVIDVSFMETDSVGRMYKVSPPPGAKACRCKCLTNMRRLLVKALSHGRYKGAGLIQSGGQGSWSRIHRYPPPLLVMSAVRAGPLGAVVSIL